MKEVLLHRGEQKLVLINDEFENRWTSILDALTYEQRQIRMFGKLIPEPRLTAWFGRSYRYSGLQLKASPIPDLLSPLFEKVIALNDGFQFNSVLINYYRDGQDSMGWHRDNEPEIDQSLIASLSFGASRKFKLRNRVSRETIDVLLESGDLLMMCNLQEDWEHSVPKTKKVNETRINLTFRRII